MNVIELASMVAKKEDLKSHVEIGDVREIIGILADMSHDDPEVLEAIEKLGMRRAKRKKKVRV